jgi:hypothetical protein
LPCIIVDAKGDLELAKRVKNIAGRLNRPFKVFSTRPENSTTYDPLKNGNALELTDKIISVINILRDAGVKDTAIQEMVGHAEISTTREHYFITTKSQREKLDQVVNGISNGINFSAVGI